RLKQKIYLPGAVGSSLCSGQGQQLLSGKDLYRGISELVVNQIYTVVLTFGKAFHDRLRDFRSIHKVQVAVQVIIITDESKLALLVKIMNLLTNGRNMHVTFPVL